jgi:O-antigen ligase
MARLEPAQREVLKGLLVASPLVAFPFSRSYVLFCLLAILAGLALRESRSILLRSRGPLLAGAAIGLPILLTILILGIEHGGFAKLWVEKLALVGVAVLLALALHALLDDARARRVAALVMALTVTLWLFDGLVQLFVGVDLFGIPLADEVDGPERIRAFFTKSTRYSYFVGFLAVPAALWLRARPGPGWLAHLLVIAGAAIVFAAGSRYAMGGYGFFMLVYLLLATFAMRPAPRLAALLGASVLLLGLASVMYHSNASFQARLDQTTVVLEVLDRDTINYTLSLRLDVWEPAVKMISERWAFGFGPSEFERQVGSYLEPDSPFAGETKIMHAHQVVIEILLATGVVGLAAFLAWYLWLIRYLWMRRRNAAFGWGCMLAYLLLWLPFGSQKDFYGSEQVLVSFYLLGLGFGFVERGDDPSGGGSTSHASV